MAKLEGTFLTRFHGFPCIWTLIPLGHECNLVCMVSAKVLAILSKEVWLHDRHQREEIEIRQ